MSTENLPDATHRADPPAIPAQAPAPNTVQPGAHRSAATPAVPWSADAPPTGTAVASGGGIPSPFEHGDAVPNAGYPASIGDRFLARLIDGGVIIAGLFVFGGLGNVLTESAPTLALVPSLIAFAIYVGYEFVAIGLFGQTIGKRVMKLRVVAVDGGPAGWGASAGRVYLPMVASFLTCGLGSLLCYLSPLFDGGPWKRGWYDQLASTVVISGKRPWHAGG